jgi:antitoxin component of MazEF toxin-antitoxin module
VVADVLEIEVPAKLIKRLGLRDGQTVSVHNKGGKFTFNWDPGEIAH